MKDGVNATPLATVNTTGYIDHAAFLGTINPDTNKIPNHLFQGYLNIYNNYFKASCMPDRTEAKIGRASCGARLGKPLGVTSSPTSFPRMRISGRPKTRLLSRAAGTTT